MKISFKKMAGWDLKNKETIEILRKKGRDEKGNKFVVFCKSTLCFCKIG